MVWPCRKTIKELREFLGQSGYYMRFIKAMPETELLRKDAFAWNESTEKFFHQLKSFLSSLLVLALPYFTIPFKIETYMHVTLELLAILFAVEKWRHYLEPNHFFIRTNQRALKHLGEQQITTHL
ncbi:hypothetical protein V2J09_022874 [Rumex salicifolius]